MLQETLTKILPRSLIEKKKLSIEDLIKEIMFLRSVNSCSQPTQQNTNTNNTESTTRITNLEKLLEEKEKVIKNQKMDLDKSFKDCRDLEREIENRRIEKNRLIDEYELIAAKYENLSKKAEDYKRYWEESLSEIKKKDEEIEMKKRLEFQYKKLKEEGDNQTKELGLKIVLLENEKALLIKENEESNVKLKEYPEMVKKIQANFYALQNLKKRDSSK